MRLVPDLSTDADPNTGFIQYFTGWARGCTQNCLAGWNSVGGTSIGSPMVSSLVAVAAQACDTARLGSSTFALRHGLDRIRRRDDRFERPLQRR